MPNWHMGEGVACAEPPQYRELSIVLHPARVALCAVKWRNLTSPEFLQGPWRLQGGTQVSTQQAVAFPRASDLGE